MLDILVMLVELVVNAGAELVIAIFLLISGAVEYKYRLLKKVASRVREAVGGDG